MPVKLDIAAKPARIKRMQKFLWVDLEMSGLDLDDCRILEIAAIVTDDKYTPVGSTFHRIVQQPQAVLDAMDEWCTKTHGESGLTAAVPNGTPETQAESEFDQYLTEHFGDDTMIILCGNSIGQDRKFIDRYLPKIAARLHYRMLDVTSWKIAFTAMGHEPFAKEGGHRALDDIKESINELRYYLSFVQPPDVAETSTQK